MHHDTALQAAQELWQHWQAGSTLDNLPAPLRPATRLAGYNIQAALPEASGRSVRGWKIAATSTAGQSHINVSGPLAGRILSGQMLEPGATVPPQGNRMRVAETEMAFVLGHDLPAQPRGDLTQLAQLGLGGLGLVRADAGIEGDALGHGAGSGDGVGESVRVSWNLNPSSKE